MDLVEFDDGVTSSGAALFKIVEALSRGAFFFSTSAELSCAILFSCGAF